MWNVSPDMPAPGVLQVCEDDAPHLPVANVLGAKAEEHAEIIATAPETLACLEWAIEQLDALSKSNAYTLGMVRSLEHCRSVAARAKGGAA